MDRARLGRFVALTHDLGLGTILAATRALGPSVVQVRAQEITLGNPGEIGIRTIR